MTETEMRAVVLGVLRDLARSPHSLFGMSAWSAIEAFAAQERAEPPHTKGGDATSTRYENTCSAGEVTNPAPPPAEPAPEEPLLSRVRRAADEVSTTEQTLWHDAADLLDQLRRDLAAARALNTRYRDEVEPALRRERDAARAALAEAAGQFERYAKMHADKHTPDGDAKAATNREWAKRCREAASPSALAQGAPEAEPNYLKWS